MLIKDGEYKILLKIINLIYDKIWLFLDKFHNPEIHAIVQRKISALRKNKSYLEDGEKTNFQQWITTFPSLILLNFNITPV